MADVFVNNPGLRVAYVEYCKLPVGQSRTTFDAASPRMSQTQFIKLLQDVGVAEPEGTVPLSVINVIFASYKPLGGTRFTFPHFHRALAAVSAEARTDVAARVAALGTKSMDNSYLASQRIFPDKAFPYVVTKASHPPWSQAAAMTSGTDIPGSGGTAYGTDPPRSASPPKPLYSNSTLSGSGSALGASAASLRQRPMSAMVSSGGGGLAGKAAANAAAAANHAANPREAWRTEDFKLGGNNGDQGVRASADQGGRPMSANTVMGPMGLTWLPRNVASSTQHSLGGDPGASLEAANQKHMEAWGIQLMQQVGLQPSGLSDPPQILHQLLYTLGALQADVAALKEAQRGGGGGGGALSDADMQAVLAQAADAAAGAVDGKLGAVEDRLQGLDAKVEAVSEALSEDIGRVITTLSLFSDKVSTMGEEVIPDLQKKLASVGGGDGSSKEVEELRKKVENVEYELKNVNARITCLTPDVRTTQQGLREVQAAIKELEARPQVSDQVAALMNQASALEEQMKGVQAGLGEVAPEAREAQQAAGELRAAVKVRPALMRLQQLRR